MKAFKYIKTNVKFNSISFSDLLDIIKIATMQNISTSELVKLLILNEFFEYLNFNQNIVILANQTFSNDMLEIASLILVKIAQCNKEYISGKYNDIAPYIVDNFVNQYTILKHHIINILNTYSSVWSNDTFVCIARNIIAQSQKKCKYIEHTYFDNPFEYSINYKMA